MTKKDYIWIAKILNDYQVNLESDSEIMKFDSMLGDLCKYFNFDNSRFDEDKFIDAVCKSN